MTVLVSGFEPFGGEAVNASWTAARRLAELRSDVVAVELPCTFSGAFPALARAIAEHRPRAVVAVGLAAGTREVRLERVAINVVDARIADNAGVAPVDEPVVPGGPAAFWSTLPIKAGLAALREREIPAVVSNTAGTYVCNATFYALMEHLSGAAPAVPGGFVHVPRVTDEDAPGSTTSADDARPGTASSGAGLPLAQVVEGLNAIVDVVVADPTRSVALAAGTEH